LIDPKEEARDSIAMSVADPGFDTDPRILKAFEFAVVNGCTHYFPAKGFDKEILPRAIARYYDSARGIQLDPLTQVEITHGAQEALSFSIHTTLKPGDEVIVPEPTYGALIDKLPIFGAKIAFVPLLEEENWHLDLDRIRSSITEKTKMIFICNPNNPTGTVYSKKEIDELREILKENNQISIIVDECYSRILYDGTSFVSLLGDGSILDQIFVVNSFSKAYAMTGWRLGYVISSKDRIDRIKNHAFEYSGGVSYAIQYAGAVALDQCSSFIDSMVEELDKRRHLMLNCLSEIEGVRSDTPNGGFELFPDFSEYNKNSRELSSKLAEEEKVLTFHGVKFGPSGEGHLRLVFCTEGSERISEGIRRIRNCINN